MVKSAVYNWKAKNEGEDESALIVKTIHGGWRPCSEKNASSSPGRGYRVRKRSNHVTVIVDAK
jgi:large subunit ribosomal protein L22